MDRRARKIFLQLAALSLGLLWASSVVGDEPSREYQIKAAFIYNFAELTSWPESAFSAGDSPFVVGIIGQDPFGGGLEKIMEGKSVGGHPITIKHLDSADQIAGCQLLFVPATEDDHLEDIFKSVADRPILTVGESSKFPWAGGTIMFFLEANKIHFEVNRDSADKAGLRISSKLMSLARVFKKS